MVFTYQSGVHATISGVLLATVIPHRKKNKEYSLLTKIEHNISSYVAFGIMPLFALANAGVSLDGINLESLLSPVPLGIVLGLFVGKQIGIFLFFSCNFTFSSKAQLFECFSKISFASSFNIFFLHLLMFYF